MDNISFKDFLKQNKIVVITFIALILLFGFLFGRKIFFNNPNNVTKFSSYGKATSTETVKTVNKNSVLGKKLPNAEEIMSEYISNNGKLDMDDFVLDKYGEEIYTLYLNGLIPSTQLSEEDNMLIALTGNYLLDDKNNYYGFDLIPNTYDYITSSGDSSISNVSNPTRDTWLYQLPENSKQANLTTTISSDNLFIQGGFVQDYTQLSGESAFALTGEAVPETPEDVEDTFDYDTYLEERVSKYHVITIPIILKKDLTIKEIKKEFKDLEFNDKKVEFLSPDNEHVYDKTGVFSNLYELERFYGEDYEIAGYSQVNASFLIDDTYSFYPDVNYLMINKKQIALESVNANKTMTTLDIFNNFKEEVD